MQNKNTEAAQEWIKFAERDLEAAKALLEDGIGSNVICFLAQQVGEKYLKAFLVYNGSKFEKMHILERLLELCSQIDSEFLQFQDDTARLSSLYVQTRYPGGPDEFSFELADSSIQKAEKIKNFIIKKIN